MSERPSRGKVAPLCDIASIKAFSETDFREDLKKFDRPTLIIHGGDDQIMPFKAAGLASSK